jgi:hypothetical protein
VELVIVTCVCAAITAKHTRHKRVDVACRQLRCNHPSARMRIIGAACNPLQLHAILVHAAPMQPQFPRCVLTCVDRSLCSVWHGTFARNSSATPPTTTTTTRSTPSHARILTTHRPTHATHAALNALCSPLMAELSAQLDEFEKDDGIGAVVITGWSTTRLFAPTSWSDICTSSSLGCGHAQPSLLASR